jgi:hypothetical protein
MAQKMIAFCGLDCAACPAFFAAQKLSMAERQKTADKWSKEYNGSFTAEQIDCVGCTAREGVQVGHCSVCEMRLCGLAKGVSTCADCPEFACARLEGFFKSVPDAKANLLALRAGG